MEKRVTIIVDGEEVTASASMLNRISLWVQEAAESPKNTTVKWFYESIGREIYDQLDVLGAYDYLK